MLADPSLSGASAVETDLCIVGAGPAGITIAREFAGTGVRVLMLESGGRQASKAGRELNRGESVGQSAYLLHRARVRAFGGTSAHWPLDEGWRARPLDPIDFESRPWMPYSGWPYDLGALVPYYERAQSICALGPFDYSAKRWEDPDRRPELPLPADAVESSVFQLGSSSFSGYYEELVRARNVTIALDSTVVELVTAADEARIERVEVRSPDGSAWSVRPRLVVLAAGGIENPRLLLLSTRTQPRGLGNAHDLVGRFFAERLSTRTGFVVPSQPGLAGRAGFYDVHVVDGTRVQGALRVAEDVQRRHKLLNGAFFVLARPRAITAESVRSLATLVKAAGRKPWPERPAGHVRNVVSGLGEIAALAAARVRPASDHRVLVLRAQAEQVPNPESRVTLGERRDRFGLPVPRLDWRSSASDREAIRGAQQVLDGAFKAAGLGTVAHMLGDEDPPALMEGNRHHMGTTRMHRDERHGVVDADGRVHGTANLFVAGSSIFPTYGCSNPTLTIVALSLKLAEHLKHLQT